MTLAFYQAYTHVLEAMLQVILKESGDDAPCIPTADAIAAQLGSSNAFAQPFFDAGGEITFALEALVDRAYEKSPEGPEYDRKPELREEESEFEIETQELPRCSHDLDFTLVRTKLGLPPQGKGPHWFFLTDDEDSEGEEENDDLYVGINAEGVSEGMLPAVLLYHSLNNKNHRG
ncbi:hypothetical protein BC835DRAFT_1377736 [Cytidiella melzeri]|nr:hypothetical protein BC835DRAFT_1377736 [Cytidiella melzeri]